MTNKNITDVFTPLSIPSDTYLHREAIAAALKKAVKPKSITCISGPSKSGKTTLCVKEIGEDRIILINGADAKTLDGFWKTLRRKIQAPSKQTVTTTLGLEGSMELGGEAKGKIPLFGEMAVNPSVGFQGSVEKGHSDEYDSTEGVGLLLVASNGQNKKVLVIDDFHIVPKSVQKDLADLFKAASSEGCSIIVILVPHRSEETIFANRDLQGRVKNINIPQWELQELEKIASKGFSALNYQLDPKLLYFLLQESIFSPQLMQALCLTLCEIKQITAAPNRVILSDITGDDKKNLLLETSSMSAFDNIFGRLVNTIDEPSTKYSLENGDEMNLSRLVLKAIAQHDTLEIKFEAIIKKISTLKRDTERISNTEIITVLGDFNEKMNGVDAQDQVIWWNPNTQSVNLYDPYFLHYLRGSDCWDM